MNSAFYIILYAVDVPYADFSVKNDSIHPNQKKIERLFLQQLRIFIAWKT